MRAPRAWPVIGIARVRAIGEGVFQRVSGLGYNGGMSTTLELPRANGQGTVSVTYDGGDPADPGPVGTLLRMLFAQVTGDDETLKTLITTSSQNMTRKEFSPTAVEILLDAPQQEGEQMVIPGHLRENGEGPDMPFVVVQEDGAWKVDMSATIDRLMSGMGLDQLMEGLANGMKQAMETMAEGMKLAMEGMEAAGDASTVADETSPEQGGEKKGE